VVILRLRGRNKIGSTFVIVLEHYAQKLQANGGKLMLSGVSERIWQQLVDTETTDTIPEEDIFRVTNKLGASTRRAIETARKWLDAPPDKLSETD
jgi:SulP family sulfate permease